MQPILNLVYLKNFNHFMKKLGLLIVTLFTLVSCSTEPVDPALLSTLSTGGGNGSGGGTGGGGTGGGGSSTGDYYPAALNNQWLYKTNGVLDANPNKMVQVVSNNGQTYYKFNAINATGTQGSVANAQYSLRKNSGDYFYKYEPMTIGAGTPTEATSTGYEVLILKDYLNVNQTWTGNYSYTVTYTNPMIPAQTQDVSYTGKILERDINYSVEGQNYTNVIHIKIDQVFSIMGTPMQTTSSEIWYAKNVGIIKSILSGNGLANTQTLSSYTLN